MDSENIKTENILSLSEKRKNDQLIIKKEKEKNVSNFENDKISFMKNPNEKGLSNNDNDIFPSERTTWNNDQYDINGPNKLLPNNPETLILKNRQKYKELVLKEDIPEMILYKYNYNINDYKDSLINIDFECEWIINFLNLNKNQKFSNKIDSIKICLKNLIEEYKKNLNDIPFIITNNYDKYKEYFSIDDIFEILTLYDAEFLRIQKRSKKLLKLLNLIISQKNNKLLENNFKNDYIKKAQNENEIYIIETYLKIIFFTNQKEEKPNNFKNSLIKEILSSFDHSIISTIKEKKYEEIINKFCLNPEQISHNIKVLRNELSSELIVPDNPPQGVGYLCQEKIKELNNPNLKPNEILKNALEYYLILLSNHPYISKVIFEYFLKCCFISTTPTDKGKEILNALHPSYRCKRIVKRQIASFFEENNENQICNKYTSNFGDLYLDIERCVGNGFIKCEVNFDTNSVDFIELSNLITEAVTGIKKNPENGNISYKDNNKNNVNIEKNNKIRKLAVKNLLTMKNYCQKYFVNYIKKELHNYSEKCVIKIICSKFYSILSRNYLDTINIENNQNVLSIIYNNHQKYFMCICMDIYGNIKNGMALKYSWRPEYFDEISCQAALNISSELSQFNKLLDEYKPKAIIINSENLQTYELIAYLRRNFKKIFLVYSDYFSLFYNIQNTNGKEQLYQKAAVEQAKYIINPVNQIMELWNYQYDENILSVISLHPFQECIKDIPLLNYCLETQIIRTINSKGIEINNLNKYTSNLLNYLCGLGPELGKTLSDAKKIYTIEDIKGLFKNNPNIFKNTEHFIINNKNIKNNLSIIKSNNPLGGLTKQEIFNTMIHDSTSIKINSFHNAIVCSVDVKNEIIHCLLVHNCYFIKGILKFSDTEPEIKVKEKFFKPQRIILCKIINIKIEHQDYEILLSNKISELISIKKPDIATGLKYFNEEADDYKLKEMENLNKIINTEKSKDESEKVLTYVKINMENEQFLKNIDCIMARKCLPYVTKDSQFIVRPSFIGEDHLTLTFYLIEDLILNYDITKIDKTKNGNSNSTNYEEHKNKNSLDTFNYTVDGNNFDSLSSLYNKFGYKIFSKIREFITNKYFIKPSEVRLLFEKIFGIKSLDENSDNLNENKVNNIEFNHIILCFMNDSPNYGLFLTKSENDNYSIDFIKITCNGYLFHDKIFPGLIHLFNYYSNYHKTRYYQDFVKRQFVCNIHSQIEEIDQRYTDFVGTDPYEYMNIEDENLKNDLIGNKTMYDSSFDNQSQNDKLLGKKTKPPSDFSFQNNTFAKKENWNNGNDAPNDDWGTNNNIDSVWQDTTENSPQPVKIEQDTNNNNKPWEKNRSIKTFDKRENNNTFNYRNNNNNKVSSFQKVIKNNKNYGFKFDKESNNNKNRPNSKFEGWEIPKGENENEDVQKNEETNEDKEGWGNWNEKNKGKTNDNKKNNEQDFWGEGEKNNGSNWDAPNNNKSNETSWDTSNNNNKYSDWEAPNNYNSKLNWGTSNNNKNEESNWDNSNNNNNKDNGGNWDNQNNNKNNDSSWNNKNNTFHNQNNSWNSKNKEKNSFKENNTPSKWNKNTNFNNRNNNRNNNNNNYNNSSNKNNNNYNNRNNSYSNNKNNNFSKDNNNFNNNNTINNITNFQSSNFDNNKSHSFSKSNNYQNNNNNKRNQFPSKITNSQNNNNNYNNNRKNNFSNNKDNAKNNQNNNFNKKNKNNNENANNDKKGKKHKKSKFSWANELSQGNKNDIDIKEEKEDDGGVIDFESQDNFGGYNLSPNEKDSNNNNNNEDISNMDCWF